MNTKPTLRSMKQSQKNLSDRYRTTRESGFQSQDERDAYVRARMPATKGAVARVLAILDTVMAHDASITSVLDVGCGPGTATLAVHDWLSQPQTDGQVDGQEACQATDLSHMTWTLLDQDQDMLHRAGGYAIDAGISEQSLNLHAQNIIRGDYPKADLVIMSYVLGEMTRDDQRIVLHKAWAATQHFLVMVHPGTHPLFQDFLTWRDDLIQWGGIIVAPCPHHNACPLSDTTTRHPTSWCHFKERIARTKEHKYLKNAHIGHEDEPYNYLIMAKDASYKAFQKPRIVTHPKKHTGHIRFDVCTNAGMQSHTISKKHAQYTLYKKKTWGDAFDALDDDMSGGV